MRKVPVKNYVLLFILVGVTVFLTYYFCGLYNQHHTKSYTSFFSTFITEIKEDDIENYVLENPNVVLYISDKTDESLEDLEKKMKEFLTEKNVYSYFVYINVPKELDKKLENFQEEYKLSLDFKNLPILIAFQDGELKEVYKQKEWDETSLNDFLTRNEVIDCD